MSEKKATGILSKQLEIGCRFDEIHLQFPSAELRFFSGEVPESADSAETGVLVAVVDGVWSSIVLVYKDGSIIAEPGQVMRGEVVANGPASYFRVVNHEDDGLAGDLPRIQFKKVMFEHVRPGDVIELDKFNAILPI